MHRTAASTFQLYSVTFVGLNKQIMKKIFNLTMAIAICAFTMQSCKSKPSEKDVQATVENFYKALANEDYARAKELGTESTDNNVEIIKMNSSMIPDSIMAEMSERRERVKNATLTFGETTFNEEGTTAEVTYTSSADGTTDQAYLVKEGDKWLIDLEGGMPAGE